MSKLKLYGAVIMVTAPVVLFNRMRMAETPALRHAPESAPAATIQSDEAFAFRKAIEVKFDFSEKTITEAFEGKLFLTWEDERKARVSLTMPGLDHRLYVRAHFAGPFEVKCLEFPETLSEAEADYVLLLKNLVLDYAFRTNRDDNGAYLAEVKSRKAGSETLITKVKSAYLDPEKAALKVERSRHEYKLAPKLREANGEEDFRLVLNGAKSAFTRSSYRLSTLAAKGPVLSERKLGACTNDFTREVKFLTRVSREKFSSDLALLKNDGQKRHEAMRGVLKALRGDPALLDEFMNWVRSDLMNQRHTSTAVGILSTLGTPEAQKELIDLFQEGERTGHLKYQVLNAFTLTRAQATESTRSFLKTQIRMAKGDLSQGAAYALGSAISNDPEGEGGREDLYYLIDALEETVSSKEKLVYIDALVNSGSREARDVIQRYVGSDDPFIRDRALLALNSLE